MLISIQCDSVQNSKKQLFWLWFNSDARMRYNFGKGGNKYTVDIWSKFTYWHSPSESQIPDVCPRVTQLAEQAADLASLEKMLRNPPTTEHRKPASVERPNRAMAATAKMTICCRQIIVWLFSGICKFLNWIAWRSKLNWFWILCWPEEVYFCLQLLIFILINNITNKEAKRWSFQFTWETKPLPLCVSMLEFPF